MARRRGDEAVHQLCRGLHDGTLPPRQKWTGHLDNRRSELTTRESKLLQQLRKTLDECQEYHDRLQLVAEQAIAFDLDEGAVVNYAKFGDVVQKIK